MKDSDKVYWITVGDIQEIAMDTLDRKLTAEEVKRVVVRMGDYLDWYDAIDLAISDEGITESGELPEVTVDAAKPKKRRSPQKTSNPE